MTDFRREAPPFVPPAPGVSVDEAGREHGRESVHQAAAGVTHDRETGVIVLSPGAYSGGLRLLVSRADLERIVAEGRALLQDIQRREALDRINAGKEPETQTRG